MNSIILFDCPNKKTGMHRRPTKVFISHSSKDKKLVDRIVDDLRSKGISVWYDKFEIQAGDNIVEKINEGLKDSKYLVLILSPNALGSSWVNEESSFGILQQITLKSVFVIPVLIEDCNIPPLLQPRRYIDFRKSYKNGIAELVERLAKDGEVLDNLSKNEISPWPDVSKSEEEYVYLYSNRFDRVFLLPCVLSDPSRKLIDYITHTLNLPLSLPFFDKKCDQYKRKRNYCNRSGYYSIFYVTV